jgi:hypothetical protein
MAITGFFPWFRSLKAEGLPKNGEFESRPAGSEADNGSNEWDDPHPAAQPRAGLGIEGYIKMMGFDVSKDAQDWMDNVKRHISEAGYPAGSVKGAFAGITAAYAARGIHYHGTARLQSWQRRDMKKNVRNAMDVIRTGFGDCRESTLLFATTLSKLGFKAAVFATRMHVVPGVLSGEPNANGMTAFQVGLNLYFYPIESNFIEGQSYDVDQQIQDGDLFLSDSYYPTFTEELAKTPVRESKVHFGILADIGGNIIWADGDHLDIHPYLFMTR